MKVPNLGVPGLMFESHPEYTGHLARHLATAGFQLRVKIHQASTDTPLEVEDGRMWWPVLFPPRNFRVWLLFA